MDPVTESVKKAFDFASETTKQLLTLSTGIIALTITFAKDILISVPFSAKVFLMLAWIVYVFSLLFGLLTLMALTGELQPPPPKEVAAAADAEKDDKAANGAEPRIPSIWAPSIKVASVLQILTFLLATVFVVVSGVLSTVSSGPLNPMPPAPASTTTNQK